jgi:hypothetical protein
MPPGIPLAQVTGGAGAIDSSVQKATEAIVTHSTLTVKVKGMRRISMILPRWVGFIATR